MIHTFIKHISRLDYAAYGKTEKVIAVMHQKSLPYAGFSKVVMVLLLVAIMIIDKPVIALAQSASESAAPADTIEKDLRVGELGEKIDALVSDAQSEASSAVIKGKSFVKTLRKKNYRASEKVSVVIANASNTESFKVKVEGPDSKVVGLQVEQETVEGERVIELIPSPEFTPGKYTVEIKNGNGDVVSTQDFLWGVLAINTNKATYLPLEVANLSIAVLDEEGYMVCDAKLVLKILSPKGKETELTTDRGIHVNDQCSKKEYSLTPDYEADYETQNDGTYRMTLTAVTKNGNYSIEDSFDVKQNVDFNIERINTTRIFPPVTYSSEFKIKATRDFQGSITEVVPESFDVYEASKSASFDNIRTVSRGTVQGEQVLGANTEVSLPFEGKRELTSIFGDVVTDPLLKSKYEEFGLEGHDGVDFEMPVGTPVLATDKGQVISIEKDGDYGSTVVIQHDWGRSYYGHLSEFKVEVKEEVVKGQEIALSGDTGLSTGPHLHYGVKPNEADNTNGYYGKIDPAPYLGLEDESSVLGASTVADIKVKVITWRVTMKQGEEVTLGYRYKTPPKSPQFYTLGPLRFFDADKKEVFVEGRTWQLAVDASNYVGKQIKTVEYSFGNSNISSVTTATNIYATDTGTGSANGWTTSAPSAGSDGFATKIEGTNIEVKQAWIEFRAQTPVAASMSNLNIALSTCPGSVASCASAPVYRALPLLGNPSTIQYYVNSAEHNIVYVKADATGALNGLSDAEWSAGVETLLRVNAVGPSLNLHTAKLVITYESEFDPTTHDEVKTVRFPIDSDTVGDTGSSRAAIAAAGNKDFSYTADIPDLASNSDIYDVFFEVSAQVSVSAAAISDGSMNARVVSGTPTVSPTYPTITNLGDTLDQFVLFKPTVGTDNFLPNTAQKLNIAAAANPIQGAGGELVVTYKYSTGAATQTETVKYFVTQNATSGSTTKNTTTIAPVISNTGVSVKNIYARAQGTLGALRNLTVFGDIDAGGGTTEKSNAYTFAFSGTEEVGTQRVIYDMSADAASFVSGGNMTVSTQWSGTLGGPTTVELFITYTWSGSLGGVQTKSVEYGMINTPLGGTAATTAQTQKNFTLDLLFPEAVTKTLRSAYIDNPIVSSDTGTPSNFNMDINQDAITAGGTGFVSVANTGEAMSFYLLKDIASSVSVTNSEQPLIYNFIADATAANAPKAIVTYDADFSQTGAVIPDKQIKTVEYSFGNSNISPIGPTTNLYATDAGSGSTNGWTTTAPTAASDGFTYKIEGTNIKVKQAWVEFRAQTAAAASLSNLDISLSTCPGSVGSCASAPVYRALPLLGNPTTVLYYNNSGEFNIVYVKADATAAIGDLSDSDWSTGVETLLKTQYAGPTFNLHTAKLVITYESDYSSTPHDEIKTVRFPLDSDAVGDTGSKQTALAAGASQDFSYTADIPDLASNSDIYDVFFEVSAQVSGAATDGSMNTRVVSGTPTVSPTYPTVTNLTTNQDQFIFFKPTVGADDFLPNTAQKLNIAATTNAIMAPGGELVVTYKYSTGAPVQTETVRYFGTQNTTGVNTKQTVTIAPVISNTGFSLKKIYVRAQAGLGTAARNLQVYGDIDNGVGPATEKSNTYTFVITGAEEVGQKRVIYDMSADAGSFVSGGNMTVSTQWSNTGAGPPSTEVFMTFTWSGNQGGTQTKTVNYFMNNATVGGTTAAVVQIQRNTALNMLFPETVTKTARSAYIENSLVSTDTTALVYNNGINSDAITVGGAGNITTSTTGESRSFISIYDFTSSIDLTRESQSLIYNFVGDERVAIAPKAVVTYDAAFASNGGSTPTLAQLMRHGLWFDNSGVRQPFYW